MWATSDAALNMIDILQKHLPYSFIWSIEVFDQGMQANTIRYVQFSFF